MSYGSVLVEPVFLYHSLSLLSAFAHRLNFQFRKYNVLHTRHPHKPMCQPWIFNLIL